MSDLRGFAFAVLLTPITMLSMGTFMPFASFMPAFKYDFEMFCNIAWLVFFHLILFSVVRYICRRPASWQLAEQRRTVWLTLITLAYLAGTFTIFL